MTWVYSTTDTAWSASFNRSNYVSQTFTATAGQTSFTVSGGYLPSLVEVYQNGVLLVNGTDVTVTSGTVVVLAVGATAGDIIQVLGNQTFNYAATVPASKGGTGLTSAGAAGNVLTSDGTNWTSAAAPVSFVTGDITPSSLTTKSGYLKCDGSVYSRSSYTALAAVIGTPLLPKNTLASSMTGYAAAYPQETNGLLIRTGTSTNSNATVNFANALATSTDGITWTLRTALNLMNNTVHRVVAYGNSTYVALAPKNQGQGQNPNIMAWMTSPDGATWTARTTTFTSSIFMWIWELAFGGTGNRFVRLRQGQGYTSVGCCTPINNDNIYLEYSSDGVTWTIGSTTTNSSGGACFDRYYANQVAGYSGGFVAAFYDVKATTNYVLYSADGVTWTNITSNINSVAAIVNGVTGISYVNGRFVLTTLAGQMYTSTTGASGSWSLLTPYNVFFASNTGVKILGNANAYSAQIGSQSYLSQDLVSWLPIQNLGLGNSIINATPAGSTRFYGCTTTQNTVIYTDLFNYTTATQFPVPSVTTYNTLSSPYGVNGAPVNFFIKT
jgi:hypothetical protein